MRYRKIWKYGVFVLLLGGSGVGCKALIPLAMLGEHKRTVPAEYDKLEGKRVVVLVWAPPETLFDFPYVRWELASFVSDRLAADVKDIDLVDARKTEDELQKRMESSIDPEAMGKHFKVNQVVYLEILELEMRRPESPTLLQGRIRSSVVVYDLDADLDEPRRFELAPVLAEYPERQPVFNDPTNASIVRRETYSQFAEMVCRKFHDYKEVLD